MRTPLAHRCAVEAHLCRLYHTLMAETKKRKRRIRRTYISGRRFKLRSKVYKVLLNKAKRDFALRAGARDAIIAFERKIRRVFHAKIEGLQLFENLKIFDMDSEKYVNIPEKFA